ncbi:DUF1707 domain-containing protein [Planobispora siamensis]|uniref:DUF1707 domain-containing protein n=1 Tax=Planobispora siamensis TaxID=936338 RepID=A0A8J3SJ03_9ACTN|nr:DUF1707 domain-containing protein [Planobispora siamensis]GIH95182.1 hypothetical protein Psi01_58120 [Planobispora siamensis]
MSGDLVPERRDLRVSHEERDAVAEKLRVAAGDGRLTMEELDQRLEVALAARTYGELEAVLRDLPAAPGVATPTPVSKELVQLKTGSGQIRRDGVWAVPRRMEVEIGSGHAILDFTQAVLTQPTMELSVAIGSGQLLLIVPPGVAADVDSVTVRSGSIRQRARLEPGAPVDLLVTVSGSVKSGSVVVRRPRRSFWDWLRRRPRP